MVCPFDGTVYDMALMRARLLDTQPTLERIRIIHKTGNVARGVALTPQHTRSEVTVRASMNPGGLRGFGLRFGTDSNQDTLYMAIGDSVDTKFLTRLPHPTKRFHRVLFDLLSVPFDRTGFHPTRISAERIGAKPFEVVTLQRLPRSEEDKDTVRSLIENKLCSEWTIVDSEDRLMYSIVLQPFGEDEFLLFHHHMRANTTDFQPRGPLATFFWSIHMAIKGLFVRSRETGFDDLPWT